MIGLNMSTQRWMESQKLAYVDDEEEIKNIRVNKSILQEKKSHMPINRREIEMDRIEDEEEQV